MDEATRLRVRAVLSSWATLLLVAAVVVGALGAWATYGAHVAPGTTTEERTTQAWSTTADFDHSATVTRENPLFPVGTELSNRSTYFTAAAPVLDGTFTVAPRGLDGNVSVDLAATLVLRSADEETTYWRDTRPLAESSAAGADGPVSLAFSLNVTEVAQRIATIEEGIGTTPGETSAAVVVDARVAGTADGDPSSLAFSRRLSLGLAGDTYTATAPGSTTETVEQTTTVRVPDTAGPLRSIGGPFALLVGAVAAGGLGYATRRTDLALDDHERARLDYLDDRAEFDEWIVAVELPPPADDVTVAEAASLADLVNLAIDTDTAVLEAPGEELFTAVADDHRYTYRPPAPTADRDGGALAGTVLGGNHTENGADATADGSDPLAVNGDDPAATAGAADDGGDDRDDPTTAAPPDAERE
ncbi:DUF5305 domain-containing protein [Halobaculum marinum]|uniref:DUF5305 domain-containing protein n=1 Tax=Halobaculum marinum TaxID=3031996 RepID=A0ABD5WX44_9EURY|nr:DUF5305 domain-containing protein [Halobaculum sp. DT55]